MTPENDPFTPTLCDRCDTMHPSLVTFYGACACFGAAVRNLGREMRAVLVGVLSRGRSVRNGE